MQCGAVFFLHIGKTAGTTVSRYLEASVPKDRRHLPADIPRVAKEEGSCATCDYHFFKLFRPEKLQPQPIEQWSVFQELQSYLSNASKPLAAIEIHHGAPGIGAELWDKYLAPWKQMLESQGCGLRMATVLRNPQGRLGSDWDYCNIKGYLDGPNAMNFCQFAAENSNTHIKYVLRGSKWLWKPEWHRLNVTEDLKLLRHAQQAMLHFDLVGRTEELDGFMGQLQKLLGITAAGSRSIENASPVDQRTDWSRASKTALKCLSDGSSVDEMLYNSYCAKSGSET